MCLTINLKLHQLTSAPKPFIATKDIVCYKIVGRYQARIYKKSAKKKQQFESMYQGFRYHLNEEYKATFSYRYGFKDVNQGIHSYRKDSIMKQVSGYVPNLSKEVTLGHSVILKCIIPEGSQYYHGESGDFVSNKLKTVKAITNLKDLKKDLDSLKK